MGWHLVCYHWWQSTCCEQPEPNCRCALSISSFRITDSITAHSVRFNYSKFILLAVLWLTALARCFIWQTLGNVNLLRSSGNLMTCVSIQLTLMLWRVFKFCGSEWNTTHNIMMDDNKHWVYLLVQRYFDLRKAGNFISIPNTRRDHASLELKAMQHFYHGKSKDGRRLRQWRPAAMQAPKPRHACCCVKRFIITLNIAERDRREDNWQHYISLTTSLY